MLRNSFYKVISVDSEELSSIRTSISIDPQNPIFKGHFPSVPVVPGVCMLQMIKEQLEDELGRSLQLTKAASLKFLSVINPLENPRLTVQVSYALGSDGSVNAEASIFVADVTFFKLARAVYK